MAQSRKTGLAGTKGVMKMKQDHGKECGYRVLAVNKAGEGEPNNTIMAVL